MDCGRRDRNCGPIASSAGSCKPGVRRRIREANHTAAECRLDRRHACQRRNVSHVGRARKRGCGSHPLKAPRNRREASQGSRATGGTVRNAAEAVFRIFACCGAAPAPIRRYESTSSKAPRRRRSPKSASSSIGPLSPLLRLPG